MNLLELLWSLAVEFLTALLRLIVGTKQKDVKGKVVLITGTARGLGRELALQFSELGSIVLCVDINTEGNHETLKLLDNNKCHAYTCDISDHDAVVKLQNDVKRDVGHVDILVNCAAILSAVSLREGTPDILKKVVDVNLLSHVWMLRVFLEDMIARNSGHIVAISSIFGLFSVANLASYCATKHAIIGLMGSLYQELQADRKNIKITTVCPAGIDTPYFSVAVDQNTLFLPLMEAKTAANIIIKGIREERTIFSIPSWIWLCHIIIRLLPTKAAQLIMEYVAGETFPKLTEEEYKRFKESYHFT